MARRMPEVRRLQWMSARSRRDISGCEGVSGAWGVAEKRECEVGLRGVFCGVMRAVRDSSNVAHVMCGDWCADSAQNDGD